MSLENLYDSASSTMTIVTSKQRIRLHLENAAKNCRRPN